MDDINSEFITIVDNLKKIKTLKLYRKNIHLLKLNIMLNTLMMFIAMMSKKHFYKN